MGTPGKVFSFQCQPWAEPFRGWSILEGEGGASVHLNGAGGGEGKRPERPESHLSDPGEVGACPDPSQVSA